MSYLPDCIFAFARPYCICLYMLLHDLYVDLYHSNMPTNPFPAVISSNSGANRPIESNSP